VSAAIVAVTVVINKVIPKEALGILMSLVVSALIINWIMITLTHMFFRKKKDAQGIKTKFPTILYPLSNYFSLLFLFGVLMMMWFTGLKISVELIPAWLLILYISYVLVKKNKAKQARNIEN
jgi:aromatic amino acid transport protein AroP